MVESNGKVKSVSIFELMESLAPIQWDLFQFLGAKNGNQVPILVKDLQDEVISGITRIVKPLQGLKSFGVKSISL